MPRKIRVLVVDDAVPVRQTIKTMLELEGDFVVIGEAGDGEEAVLMARKLRPDAILMDINLPKKDGITAAGEIVHEMPVHVVMVSVESDRDYLRRAMQAGAKDFLVKPFSSQDLAAALRQGFSADAVGGGGRNRGKIITVFSTKGGVGKSTITANLGIALTMSDPDLEIALVDLDLEFGVLATMLGIKPRSSIVDLCRAPEMLTQTQVREALTPVPHASLSLLAAPPLPHLAAEVDGDGRADRNRNYVEEILVALREGFDFVVVDTPPNFRDATMAALDLSDLILMVTTPDIPSLQNTVKGMNILLNQLDFDRDKIRVILNQVDEHHGLTAEEVGHALDFPIWFSLPVDRAVVTAANVGQPVVLTRRTKSQAGIQIGRMADALLDRRTEEADGGRPASAPDKAESGRRDGEPRAGFRLFGRLRPSKAG